MIFRYIYFLNFDSSVMSNYSGQYNKNLLNNHGITKLIVGCICVLVMYQFIFGNLISIKSRSAHQSLYEQFLTSTDKNAYSNVTFSTEFNYLPIAIGNDMITTNSGQADNDSNSLLLFAKNKFWFQEKMTNYSKVLVRHSEASNKTKKILSWNKNFGGGLR